MARLEPLLVNEVVETEADGSLCFGCGDAIYLKAYEIYLVGKHSRSRVAKLPDLLCQGCGEIMKQENEGMEGGPAYATSKST